MCYQSMFIPDVGGGGCKVWNYTHTCCPWLGGLDTESMFPDGNIVESGARHARNWLFTLQELD